MSLTLTLTLTLTPALTPALTLAQLWNTLTLPHYDNGRERFVVSEPITNATTQAARAVPLP